MGRHRSPNTSDALYLERRERYVANRDRLAVKAKARYQQERTHLLRANKLARQEIRKAKLAAKRAAFYQEHPHLLRKSSEAIQGDRQSDTKDYVRRSKEASPCLDCGKPYPYYVMDYDHVRGEKTDDISSMTQHYISFTRIQAEMDKCDLVCANCHRERTFQRQQNKNLKSS